MTVDLATATVNRLIVETLAGKVKWEPHGSGGTTLEQWSTLVEHNYLVLTYNSETDYCQLNLRSRWTIYEQTYLNSIVDQRLLKELYEILARRGRKPKPRPTEKPLAHQLKELLRAASENPYHTGAINECSN